LSAFSFCKKSQKINISSAVSIDTIELININGQIVNEIKNPVFENNTFTMENLPQGFYFLKLTTNNQSVTKKVIIN